MCAVPISAGGNSWGRAYTSQSVFNGSARTSDPTLVVPDGTRNAVLSRMIASGCWSRQAPLLRAEALGGRTATTRDYPDGPLGIE
jgi:hypothetical protein